MRIGQFCRLWQIAFVWLKYGLDEVVFTMPLLKAFKVFAYLNPAYWMRNRKLPKGDRLCMALESLGPIFVKFGQILSTRRDFLPDDIANSLAKLQDSVKPFDSELAIQTIESSLGKPIDELFATFDKTPLASASIAQVHAATLTTGEEVVVKVLRPGIHKTIKRDIALMYRIARFCERAIKITRRLRAVDIVREMERTLVDELDLTREGANAVQLKRNLEGDDFIYVPEVYWDKSSDSVLVTERINGISISNIEELKARGTNMKKLAEGLMSHFYKQSLTDCYFHADMHPGNIFVSVENPDQPVVQLVDFGIMGSLDKTDQHYLAANFLAFFSRDYRRVAELHIECGWVPQKTRVTEFEASMRAVCEPIFQKPLSEISLGQALLRLFQIAQRYDMIIQPQLLLLQKTLWNIEGVCRMIYEDMDIWGLSRPLMQDWMKKHIGVGGLYRRLKEQWPHISQSMPEIPELLYSLLKDKQMERNLARQERELAFENRDKRPPRKFGFISGVGLAIAAVGIAGLTKVTPMLQFNSTAAITTLVVGVVLLGIGYLTQ